MVSIYFFKIILLIAKMIIDFNDETDYWAITEKFRYVKTKLIFEPLISSRKNIR